MSVKDWMPAVARAAASDRKLKKGESLFRRGSKTAGLYEVLSGYLRLVRVDRAGREAVLHVAGPGDTFAEASLFSAQYHCDAIASTNATVRLYPKRELMAALEENPKANTHCPREDDGRYTSEFVLRPDVRFWPKADIPTAAMNIRFWG
jgi:CRP/FNR family transcriptional regulator, dissimilatory nitrate respiration regulator